jgi:hypothetical protein
MVGDTKNMTPWERSQTNGGFPMNSRNRLQVPEVQAKDEGDKPPNLRDAGTSQEMCGNCEHWDGPEGGCSAHAGYPCIESEVCDDYAPKGEGDQESMPESMPEKGMPEGY